MDVNGIANLTTSLAEVQSSQSVGVSVLKKALDVERDGAAALLNALPPPSAVNLPAHLGQSVNTTA